MNRLRLRDEQVSDEAMERVYQRELARIAEEHEPSLWRGALSAALLVSQVFVLVVTVAAILTVPKPPAEMFRIAAAIAAIGAVWMAVAVLLMAGREAGE